MILWVFCPVPHLSVAIFVEISHTLRTKRTSFMDNFYYVLIQLDYLKQQQ